MKENRNIDVDNKKCGQERERGEGVRKKSCDQATTATPRNPYQIDTEMHWIRLMRMELDDRG